MASQYQSTVCPTLRELCSQYLSGIRLLRAGDIETNPGPTEGQANSDDLSDKFLIDIARIVPHDKYQDLGVKLEFDLNYVDTILAGKQTQDRYVQATRSLLIEWKNTHGSGPDQRKRLEDILASVGIEGLPSNARPLEDGNMLNSGVPDKVIAGNFTLHSCRQKLKHRYKTKLCKVQIKPWDKGSIEDVNKMYTVVTMYKKDADGKNTGEREKITLAGSVDDIFKTKVNGMLPDRIVVIAGAGKGKTTAVAKMAYDWAYNVQDSAFEKLPLLFIIRLRDVRSGSSLGEAIIEQLLHDIPVLIPEPLDNFIRMNQELCWIILDGLDEYRGTLDPSASLKKTIVDVISTRELPSCRVLVTTRPHLEHEFEQGELPQIYAKMEIGGFSTENSKQYIEKFFRSDRAIGNELQTYLHKNDVISELVSTPLFCLMICYLWRENLLFGIETQTELFDSVNVFLYHHCREKSSQYTEEWLSSTVHQLGEIALKGLLSDNNKLVFRPEDFKEKPDVMQDGCELGIIAITSSNEVSDTVFREPTKMQSIEFYHKLAQEHTAGKYLAKITTTFKMALNVSKLDRVMRSKSQCIGNYEHLLRFASGRSNDICFRIITRIISNKSLDNSERYRIILDCSSESPGLEGNVSSMVQGCVTDKALTLKSPTVYTVVGMKKLPESLKREV